MIAKEIERELLRHGMLPKGDSTDYPTRIDMDREMFHAKEVFLAYDREIQIRLDGLKELILQRDKSTEIAISKSEAMYNERFSKANEFREQLKDMIATLARKDQTDAAMDAMRLQFEQNIVSVTERFELNQRAMNDRMIEIDRVALTGRAAMKEQFEEKVATTEKHILSIINQLKEAAESKREGLFAGIQGQFKSMQEMVIGNIKVEAEKFTAVDRTMSVRIDTNAEVSNTKIDNVMKEVMELKLWKQSSQGSLIVIKSILGFLSAICISLIIWFLTHQ